MKTMNDIKGDMSALYDEVRKGSTDLKTAAELANIAGKFLKAEQLMLAREIFTDGRASRTLQASESQDLLPGGDS